MAEMSDDGAILLRAAELLEAEGLRERFGDPRPEVAAAIERPEQLAEVAQHLREIGMQPEDLGLAEWP